MRQVTACIILAAFLTNTFVPPSFAQTLMPAPGQRVALSDSSHPAILTGIKVYPDDPLRMDLILDPGDGHGSENEQLIRYFLASLAIPNKDLWVNLSPYEKDRIIPEAFGQTEMGRDLLAQDYLLKQITSSLMYPEDGVGKEFWAKAYAKAQEQFGTTDIPLDTFNKVWIVPAKARVFENGQAAFVVESRLKVMLEADYLAAQQAGEGASQAISGNDVTIARDVIRQVIIPILEKEINEGGNFAAVRQVYNSLILALWYKKKVKDGILAKAYVDRKKVRGVNINDPQEAEKIWGQYVEAFKKGAFDFIKEEEDPYSRELIPRKYFSGGVNYNEAEDILDLAAARSELPSGSTGKVIQMRVVPETKDGVRIDVAKEPQPSGLPAKGVSALSEYIRTLAVKIKLVRPRIDQEGFYENYYPRALDHIRRDHRMVVKALEQREALGKDDIAIEEASAVQYRYGNNKHEIAAILFKPFVRDVCTLIVAGKIRTPSREKFLKLWDKELDLIRRLFGVEDSILFVAKQRSDGKAIGYIRGNPILKWCPFPAWMMKLALLKKFGQNKPALEKIAYLGEWYVDEGYPGASVALLANKFNGIVRKKGYEYVLTISENKKIIQKFRKAEGSGAWELFRWGRMSVFLYKIEQGPATEVDDAETPGTLKTALSRMKRATDALVFRVNDIKALFYKIKLFKITAPRFTDQLIALKRAIGLNNFYRNQVYADFVNILAEWLRRDPSVEELQDLVRGSQGQSFFKGLQAYRDSYLKKIILMNGQNSREEYAQARLLGVCRLFDQEMISSYGPDVADLLGDLDFYSRDYYYGQLSHTVLVVTVNGQQIVIDPTARLFTDTHESIIVRTQEDYEEEFRQLMARAFPKQRTDRFEKELARIDKNFSLMQVKYALKIKKGDLSFLDDNSELTKADPFEGMVEDIVNSTRLALMEKGEREDRDQTFERNCIWAARDFRLKMEELQEKFPERSSGMVIRQHEVLNVLKDRYQFSSGKPSRHQDKRSVYRGLHSHIFLVVSQGGRDFLVDPTFVQFFNPKDKDDPKNPGYIINTAAQDERFKSWGDHTAQLLRNGYIELTDDVANMYLTALAGNLNHERTDFKVDQLLIPSTAYDVSRDDLDKIVGHVLKISPEQDARVKEDVERAILASSFEGKDHAELHAKETLQKTVLAYRAALLKKFGNDVFSSSELGGRCVAAQEWLEKQLLMFAPSAKIRQYQAIDVLKKAHVKNVKEKNFHAHLFLVASYLGKDFLIDPTFLQFFDPDRKTPAADIIDGIDEIEGTAFRPVAEQLLKDGFIELTDDVADMYLSVLAGEFPVGRQHFRKRDLLVRSISNNIYSDEKLNELVGAFGEEVNDKDSEVIERSVIEAMAGSSLRSEGAVAENGLAQTDLPGFISQAVLSERIALLKLLNSKDPRNVFLSEALKGKCAYSSADVAKRILEAAETSDRPVLHRHQIVRVLQRFGIVQREGHGFLVVSTAGKDYLVDVTYLQFFSLTDKDLEGNPGNIINQMVNNGKPQWAVLARQLLRDGAIELTDEVADMYLTSFSGNVSSNRKVFTKNDLLWDTDTNAPLAATFEDNIPEDVLRGLMGPLDNFGPDIDPLGILQGVDAGIGRSSVTLIEQSALEAQQMTGGIDLQSAEKTLETTGTGVGLNMSGVDADWNNIDGIRPVIMGVTPLADLPEFLGVK